ncbi:uncharacterized protein [Argopecten irradians]|uniref:uncharacterized protein n=1 Tax=Argopecten irradians TaxID=31199 RepID=UPI003713D244
MGQTRLNQMGLVLSHERRLKFQDSVNESSNKLLVDHLKKNPLIKITGDNLDIYVKTSQINTERRNQDLHLFTSNIIFSRLARIDMDNKPPRTDVNNIGAEKILLSDDQKDQLLDAYGILVGRIMCRLPALTFMKPHIPSHIPHQNAKKMSEKSTVLPLPIQFKNESKREDCLGIMDSYENTLVKLYTDAFGNTDILRQVKVPIGGDQLTRVRLQESKNLRTLSVSPERRFDDLHPIVFEMWHNKQDFLEKCFKTLYKPENSPGTLHHFKTILHRSDVNGKVKGRFEPHHNLLIAVGEGLLTEQILEFFNMEDGHCDPQHSLLGDFAKQKLPEKKNIVNKILREFLCHYGYGNVGDCKGASPVKHYKVSSVTADGKFILQEVQDPEDELQNYSQNLCHWALHLMELDDTAKEGDLARLLLNCRYSVPFFYSHSPLSKYLVENIDYLLKTEYLLSPLQRCRVLEGSFVNIHGGVGRNVESDLVQEHSVCNQKSLIKTLCANKSKAAIRRVTGAADMIADLCEQFDKSVGVKSKSSRHSKCVSPKDLETIEKTLRKLRPFKHTPGRKCPGFKNIKPSPLLPEKVPLMKAKINTTIKRLTRGLTVPAEEFDDNLIREFDEEFLPAV